MVTFNVNSSIFASEKTIFNEKKLTFHHNFA